WACWPDGSPHQRRAEASGTRPRGHARIVRVTPASRAKAPTASEVSNLGRQPLSATPGKELAPAWRHVPGRGVPTLAPAADRHRGADADAHAPASRLHHRGEVRRHSSLLRAGAADGTRAGLLPGRGLDLVVLR